MAAVNDLVLAAALAAALAGCDHLQGFSGPVPPLATFDVEVTGSAPGAADLAVAVVWGRQWLVEPLCVLPLDPRDDSNKVAAVIAAGCRNPFGFVPARVAANVPIELGTPGPIELLSLPDADLMVGDLTARVAYAGLVVYDDVNGNGTLDLAQPNRPPDRGPPPANDLPIQTPDVVYGGSFVAMTAPDQRITYREGAFIQSGFYPRAGCGDPPLGFSVDAASGFTAEAAVSATLAGTVPNETDPAQCQQRAPGAGGVAFATGSTADRDIAELKCSERITDSTVRYREPPTAAPDFTNRTIACVHYPSFGAPSDVIELVVSGQTTDSCVGLTHYILKGCAQGISCGTAVTWDHSLAPPSWWPC